MRAGHHCARPVCVRYGIPATTRASFGVYTTTDEIDALVRGIRARCRRCSRVTRCPMESMYQQIILDHYKHPQHRGLLEPFDAEVHHVNPTCGDEVTLRVRLEPTARSPTSAGTARAARSARRRRR